MTDMTIIPWKARSNLHVVDHRVKEEGGGREEESVCFVFGMFEGASFFGFFWGRGRFDFGFLRGGVF